MKNTKELEKLFLENKLAHIYILETNNSEKLLCDLKNLFHKILNTKLVLDNNPNFLNIMPEGKNIKKEQILELRRKLSLKPIISKNNLFVINEAEKLSLSSSNSMLKILEEPHENSYGFLITNNVENIILTIKSRAQILRFNYQEVESEFVYMNELIHYVKLIMTNKNKAHLYNLQLKEILENKEVTVVFVKELLRIFMYYLNVSSVNKTNKIYEEFSFLGDLKYNILYNKTNKILSILDTLNYNVNIELVLDKLVMEIGEENE